MSNRLPEISRQARNDGRDRLEMTEETNSKRQEWINLKKLEIPNFKHQTFIYFCSMKTPSNSVRDCRKYYANRLESVYGSSEANALIMILLEHYFNIDKIKIAMEPELRLSESELLTLHFAVKELLKNKPIQYIIGETEFCGLRFFVNENVLIPRPETEEIVNMIVARKDKEDVTSRKDKNMSSCKDKNMSSCRDKNMSSCRDKNMSSCRDKACLVPSGCHILDIGTGSGCIAISLAKLLKDSIVTAVDISEKALEVTKKNAEANGVNVRFICDDILNPKNPELIDNQFDIIVSNPPYVCESEKSAMRANVLDHEPSTALFVSDNDPLIFYRKILEFAQKTLKPNGQIWFEINEKFGKETAALCREMGFGNVENIKDFRGKERVVRAKAQQNAQFHHPHIGEDLGGFGRGCD